MTDSGRAVHREVFVVRVWREAASGVWRGQIVHVSDRAAIYFASFAQAEEFMRRYVSGAQTRRSAEEHDRSEADAA